MKRIRYSKYVPDPAGEVSLEDLLGALSDYLFEVTDKSLDFLGLQDAARSAGVAGQVELWPARHAALATGIEASGASKQYEFGDTLNLDTTATLSAAIAREGITLPLNIEYSDLQVHQCEYQSSCATVVMLDCSHSMILYGEDRFTPAKKVAMALSHLIRTQYPGDSLNAGAVSRLGRRDAALAAAARAGGTALHQYARGSARGAAILSRQRKDMKQIVMITDGKPSALTLAGRAHLQECLWARSRWW
jgi:Ca-activated chloride channel family protein